MIPDPPIRKDSTCAVCLAPRKPERSKRYARDAAERDAFCSTNCCRKFHGTELTHTELTGEPEEVAV
jgi:hypothetical protein